MNMKYISISIAFLVWAAVFFNQAVFGISFGWILLTMFVVSLPVGGWIAHRITGVNPYEALFN